MTKQVKEVKEVTKDFDSFFKEIEGKPIMFKLFNKVESIPASLPAMILLKLNRAWREYGNKELPEAVNLDLSFEVFGEKQVEKWCNKGLTSQQLEELLKWAFEQYNIGTTKAGDDGGKDGKK